MKRVGFLLKVKEDRIEEYKAHHRAVWPDMLDALSRNGWHNYSLFMRERRIDVRLFRGGGELRRGA